MNKIRLIAVLVLVSILGTGVSVGFLRYKNNLEYFGFPKSVDNQQISAHDDLRGRWEQSFFTALDERTQKANLSTLRTVSLPDQDLEVRFWYDGRPDVINGFVIRRSGEQWSAVSLRQVRNRQPFEVILEALEVPKSGWDAAWTKLVSAGILSIPDASELNCNAPGFDTTSFVIETSVHGKYRAYRYSNPFYAECDEAKRIILIEKIITEEFQLQNEKK